MYGFADKIDCCYFKKWLKATIFRPPISWGLFFLFHCSLTSKFFPKYIKLNGIPRGSMITSPLCQLHRESVWYSRLENTLQRQHNTGWLLLSTGQSPRRKLVRSEGENVNTWTPDLLEDSRHMERYTPTFKILPGHKWRPLFSVLSPFPCRHLL